MRKKQIKKIIGSAVSKQGAKPILVAVNKNHVDWLKKYVNSPEFISLYPDKQTLDVVAEATFWSVQLGLAPLLAKMSYTEIREFKPLDEWAFKETKLSVLIGQVVGKLMKATNAREESIALGQAAWAIYIKTNGYDVMKEEEARYESFGATSRMKSKL